MVMSDEESACQNQVFSPSVSFFFSYDIICDLMFQFTDFYSRI